MICRSCVLLLCWAPLLLLCCCRVSAGNLTANNATSSSNASCCISDVCYPDGAPHPQYPLGCLACNASNSTTSWSLTQKCLPPGQLCMDPDFIAEVLCTSTTEEPNCTTLSFEIGCYPGFFKYNSTVFACCPGFYCPEDFFCLSLCSIGGYCPSPTYYQDNTSICETYDTSPNAQVGCGGSSSDFYCPAGYYCPNPFSAYICPSGSYCRAGSGVPSRCPAMGTCSEGCQLPDTAVAVVVPVVVFALFALAISFDFPIFRKIAERVREKYPEFATKMGVLNRRLSFNLKRTRSTTKMTDAADRSVVTSADFPKDTLMHKHWPIAIACEHLSLKVGKLTVLDDVSLRFLPGELTAILGPSGSGKTSLASTLLGKAFYGEVSGRILVNDEELSHRELRKLRPLVGYVPQDHILLPELTVQETFEFSANYRLPTMYSRQRRRDIVELVTSMLNLNNRVDSLVGSVETRGLSGGEIARVNLGVELVADPTFLVLDEPTSGLDSANCERVVLSLKALSRLGATVVAILHQPRYETFVKFDKIVLMAQGGRVAFHGSVQEMRAYFSDLDLSPPPKVNEADFYIDLLSDKILNPSMGVNVTPDFLVAEWKKHVEKANQAKSMQDSHDLKEMDALPAADEMQSIGSGAHPVGSVELADFRSASTAKENEILSAADPHLVLSPTLSADVKTHLIFPSQGSTDAGVGLDPPPPAVVHESSVKLSVHSDQAPSDRDHSKFSHLSVPSRWRPCSFCSDNPQTFESMIKLNQRPNVLWQLYYCTCRALLQLKRIVSSFVVDSIIIFICGLLVALVLTPPVLDNEATLEVFTVLITGLASVTQGIQMFVNERPVFWREAGTGLNRFAYFMGKNLAYLVVIVIMPLTWLCSLYFFYVPYASFGDMYACIVIQFAVASGVGQFAATLVKPSQANIVGVCIGLIATLFSGFSPRLSQLNGLGVPGEALYSLSYARWMQEMLYIQETTPYTPVAQSAVEVSYTYYSYTTDHGSWDINTNVALQVLVAMIFGYRLVAFLTLIFVNRTRQI